MNRSNNKISTISNQKLPFFIREDHPTFALFIKKYYEFMEQYESILSEGQVIERLNNLLNNIDIDNTTHSEIDEELYKKFLKGFPKETVADKDIILKYIKQFYRGKGTEKSLKFLVNVLSGDDDIEFYYPKKDILIASDGKWFVQKLLRVKDIRYDGVLSDDLETLEKFTNLEISGNTSNGIAAVESVNKIFDRGIPVSELFISDVSGTFEPNDTITGTYIDADGNEHSLTANTYGDAVLSIIINDGGSGYQTGQYLTFNHQTGIGANAIISKVSTGNLSTITVLYGGAGFRNGDSILFSSGSANAFVELVDTSETYHPNSYNISATTIEAELDTPLSNSVYSNLNSTNAKSLIIDALNFFAFDNVGPAVLVEVDVPGTNLIAIPSVSIVGNTVIREIGILGRMDINDGGLNYEIDDPISFIGGSGYGAEAKVSAVDANGVIEAVEFVEVNGFYIGGEGYSMTSLPSVEITSANGTGANITVTSILGFGETLGVSNSTIGTIETIDLISGGTGYNTAPTIDMTGLGDQNANLEALLISGYRTLPGIFLNDDGFLSSHNYLRGYHYYQNHSYVVRSRMSLKPYVDILKSITHPAGMKFFSDLIIENDTVQDIDYEIKNFRVSYRDGTFVSVNTEVTITLENHGLVNGNSVWLEFHTANQINSIYTVTVTDSNTFITSNETDESTSGNVSVGINTFETD